MLVPTRFLLLPSPLPLPPPSFALTAPPASDHGAGSSQHPPCGVPCLCQQAPNLAGARTMHVRLPGVLARVAAPPPAVLGLYMQLLSSACVTVMSLVAKVRCVPTKCADEVWRVIGAGQMGWGQMRWGKCARWANGLLISRPVIPGGGPPGAASVRDCAGPQLGPNRHVSRHAGTARRIGRVALAQRAVRGWCGACMGLPPCLDYPYQMHMLLAGSTAAHPHRQLDC